LFRQTGFHAEALTVRATSKDFHFTAVDAPPKLGIGFVNRSSICCVESFFSQPYYVRLIRRAGN
jgi:hypothetical protein